MNYLLLLSSFVTGISSSYFFWTSGDPHRSGFKLHIIITTIITTCYTRTTVFESHSFRRRSASTRNTAAHADLGSEDRCRKSSQHLRQRLNRNSQNAPKFYRSLNPLRYQKLLVFFGLLFFFRSALMRGHNSCFLATALVWVLFRVCHRAMFLSWSYYSSTTVPAICPLLVRFSQFLKK